MLGAPRKLDEESLKTQVEQGLGKLRVAGEEETRDFLVVTGSTAILKRAGRLYMIRSEPRPVTSELEEWAERIDELRTRKAFQEHKAVLRLMAMSDPGGGAELHDEISVLAKIAAELLAEDGLLLSFSTDRGLFVVDEKTRDHLRSTDPVKALRRGAANPAVLGAAGDDAEMNAAIAAARKTWPRFVSWLETHPAESGYAKWPVTEDGKTEHLWVRVTKLETDTVHGVVENAPVDLRKVKIGEKVSFPARQISDWMYLEGGKLNGGYTVEVLRKRAERR
jgi:uncharacterized protein YegJ (DUF2314 family)